MYGYHIMKQLNELLHVLAGKKVRELFFLDGDYTAHELDILCETSTCYIV